MPFSSFKKYKKLLQDDSFLRTATLLLLAVALVLGYLIYQQNNAPSSAPSEVGGASQQNNASDSRGAEDALANIPANKRELFLFPTPDSSQEEKQSHASLVSAEAVRTNTLDITNCETTPLVLSSTFGSSLTVMNEGATEHALQVGPDEIARIEAGESAQITLDFEFGPGTYVYGCDNLVAGIFVLDEPAQ